MVLWFAGLSVVGVWIVFRSPGVDYRYVVAGALLPLVELPFGEPRLLHSISGAVLALVLAMLIRPRRRLAQRRLVGVPIGMFLHLVLDGIWANTTAFWWPFAGWAWSDERLPELARGPWNLLLEMAGLAALVWCWQRFDLSNPERRERFRRTGQVDRELMG